MVSGSPSKRGLMMILGEAKLGARERDWRDALLFLFVIYFFYLQVLGVATGLTLACHVGC